MSYTDTDRKYYFPDIIRKVTVSFMSLFKDIRVAKYDESNNIINYRNVPITFGSKQKFTQNLKKSNQYDFSTYLPRIGVIITAMAPNPGKVQGCEIQTIFKDSASATQFDNIYRPSPYTMDFTVSLVALHISEVNQIIEQILPFFNPSRTITIQEFDMIPSFTRDIKVTIKSTEPNFMDEVVEEDIRKIYWDINFSCDVFLYKPILMSNIVKSVNVELFDMTGVAVSGTDNLVDTYTYTVSGDESNYIVTEDEWK